MRALKKQEVSTHKDLDTLKSRLKTLISDARKNEQILRKFQALELRLLACNSLVELMQVITQQSRSTFGWDTLTIILEDDNHQISQLLSENDIDFEQRNALTLMQNIDFLRTLYNDKNKPILTNFDRSKHESLFAGKHRYPSSVALLPLQRSEHLFGSLNLGCFKADRFDSDSATDFLQHLAAVLATCLSTMIVHEKLKRAGLTDALTNVNNRRFFDQRLSEEIARAERVGQPLNCLFIDIDHFKVINDTYGHEVGDQVLKKVAELIRAQLRSMDVVARYGGEEFSVLLDHSSIERAEEIAERIRAIIADHCFDNEGCASSITVSVGISTVKPDQFDKVDSIGRELLRNADKALYKAKHSGRNKVVLYEPQPSSA